MPKSGGSIGARLSLLADRVREWRIASWLRTRTWSGTRAWLGRILGAIPERTEQARRIVSSIALIAAIAVGIWIVVDLSSNEPIAFDTLHLHGDLDKRLPPAKRLTDQIGTHFESLAAAIGQLRDTERASLVRDSDLPKLEILGSGISFQAAIHVVRRLFGHDELRVGGEIFLSATPVTQADDKITAAIKATCAKDDTIAYVVVRLSTNRSEQADAAELPACVKAGQSPAALLSVDALDFLLQLATLRALERINPCGAAAYYTNNWYRRGIDGRLLDPDFRRSSQLVAACIATRGSAEAGYAFYQLGRVRQVGGRHSEAIAYYTDAEKLHRRAQAWWRFPLHWLGLWRIRLPDLDIHWGNALMDVQQPAKALEKYERDLKRGDRSAGAYIGKGNALREQARKDGAKSPLTEICAIYRAGGKHHRFNAELRHVLANLVEEDQAWSCTEVDDRNLQKAKVLSWRRKAVDLQPTDTKYLLALGRTMLSQGDADGAATVFREVIRLGGDAQWDAYRGLEKALAEIERRQGQRPPASAPPSTMPPPAGTTGSAAPPPGDVPPVPERRPADTKSPPATRPQTQDERLRYAAALASIAEGASEESVRRASELLAGVSSPQEARLALACTEHDLQSAAADQLARAGSRQPDVEIDRMFRKCLNEIRQGRAMSER